MRIVRINTTAYQEEDLVILTNIPTENIKAVITPIVMKEREDDEEYLNEDLVEALKEAFPLHTINVMDDAEEVVI
jgi:hypothetical protein